MNCELGYCSSHEALLSDEEAQEVVRLLSPTPDPEKEKDEPDWLQDVLNAATDKGLVNNT